MPRFASLVDSLGGTPLVGLPSLSPTADVRLWAKLEDHNPTGSIKDRAAIAMIEAAEKAGEPAPRRHHPGADQWQHRHLAGDGGPAARLPADLRDAGEHLDRAPAAAGALRSADHLLPAAGGSNQAVAVAKGLAAEHDDWVMLYQYGNPANAEAHYTAPAGDPGRPALDHPLRRGLGTTGTLMGVSRYLREQKPDVQGRRRRAALRRARLRAAQHRRGVRPRALRPDAARTRGSPSGRGRPPPHPAARRARGHLRRHLDRRDPARGARHRRQGGRAGAEADIVFIVCDGGWKYLSTGAYAGTLEEATSRLEGQLWA
jgi:cysteine synthase B